MMSVLASGEGSGGINVWVGIALAIFLILLNGLFVAAEFGTSRRNYNGCSRRCEMIGHGIEQPQVSALLCR